MNRKSTVSLIFAINIALAYAACGDGDEGDGDCPDLSGAWRVTAHSCQEEAIGTTMSFDQSGCVIRQIEPWDNWNGSIDEEGNMVLSGPTDPGETMTCQATLNGTTFTATCNPPCEVTAVEE